MTLPIHLRYKWFCFGVFFVFCWCCFFFNNKMMAMGACFCLLSGAQTSRADFALNWAPDAVNRFGDNTLPYVNCNRGEQNVNCIDQSARISPIQDPDKTPFLQERVIGSDGQVYYHVIV